ncbi:hypothetical protein NONO_c31260 [Nocardia nova SH22a]|uniref:Uncharacterized protein n=1 Tax=Nocardia nova SH22a TaxID=1415166 RepID=W5TG20_9NOCA|nr:hypothetical protein [Nocardia nova]AHH17913.1 hypothetical protein NONO_c31260 [Nocardia nova SH22a]
MKTRGEINRILAAYDRTGSYRAAARLAECDHHTVARYVTLRNNGITDITRKPRRRPIDDYRDHLDELVARTAGVISADIAHRQISDMGFAGTARTTRLTVAEAKARYRETSPTSAVT